MIAEIHPDIGRGDAERLWDLERLGALMAARVEEARRARSSLSEAGPEEAFRAKFLTGDGIVKALAEDPLLPPRLLPDGWAAGELREEFRKFDEEATDRSRPFWSRIIRKEEA